MNSPDLDKRIRKLAEKARGIQREKFRNLSAKSRHELLAALAWVTDREGSYPEFQQRYNHLITGSDMDRYSPPTWLTETEALQEYFQFHNRFTIFPLEPRTERAGETGHDPPLSWAPQFDVTVVMDQVRSPYNAGSILRLIDNFGFAGLVHNSSWLRLDHSQLRKSARGCETWIPVTFVENLQVFLSESKIPVIAIECCDDAISISEWTPPDRCILMVGNEEYGIASGLLELCREHVRIPLFGRKNSMNVHHALAVVASRIVSPMK